MNKKLIFNYLTLTFGFSYFLWGILIVLTKAGIARYDHPLCMMVMLLGSFGPAFGSYLSQRKTGQISSLKKFIKKSFCFRSSLASYGLMLLFLILYFIYPLVFQKYESGIPIYMSFLLIPLMLLGGGMEETGWRWILQPEFEKIFPFIPSVILTSVIWTLWHIPLFFIEGSSQSRVSFLPFFLLIIGMSFAQAVLFKLSKNVWISILLHCSFNAFQMSIVVEETLITSIIIAIILIFGSLITLIISQKYIKK